MGKQQPTGATLPLGPGSDSATDGSCNLGQLLLCQVHFLLFKNLYHKQNRVCPQDGIVLSHKEQSIDACYIVWRNLENMLSARSQTQVVI